MTMAMSLAAPTESLDGARPFNPPAPLHGNRPGHAPTPFLWQAPASDAVVFMGDKWVELHAYASRALARQQGAARAPAEKLVSRRQPAWMEHALQLARLRAYVTLYPSKEAAAAVVAAHTDLPSAPEEYDDAAAARASGKERAEKGFLRGEDGGFDAASPVMLDTLLLGSHLSLADGLLLLAWDGVQKSVEGLVKEANGHAAEFRRAVGGCSEKEARSAVAKDDMSDLFC